MHKTTDAPFGQTASFVEDYGNASTTQQSRMDPKAVSAQTLLIVQAIFLLGGSAAVSFFGIIANIINITVFIKQGAYKECGSVNLLGLAISDLCVVITMFYNSIMSILVFINPPNLSWDPFDVSYVTGGWSHLMFAQMTRAITAYVSFERCVCVVLPFKVKTLLSPKRSMVIMAIIFFCIASSYAPAFVIYRVEFRHDPYTNRTRLMRAVTSISDLQAIIDIMWYLNSIAFNLGSVTIVLICTLTTVSRVKLSKTWRKSMTAGSASTENTTKSDSTNVEKQNADAKSNSKMQKEKRLVAMILSISIIFLFCYLPDLIYLLMYSTDTEIRSLGRYHNLALVMYALTFFMETFNSSINIFVYYKMSSRYKVIFRQLFGLSEEEA